MVDVVVLGYIVSYSQYMCILYVLIRCSRWVYKILSVTFIMCVDTFQVHCQLHSLCVYICSRYIVSYIPGGQTGLKFFSNIFYAVASKTVSKTLPV